MQGGRSCIGSIRAKIALIHHLVTGFAFIGAMISLRQIRAARALLGWSQQKLADEAIVSVKAVARLERNEVSTRTSTLEALENTLSKAGIIFIPASDGAGEGVRLASDVD